MCAMPTRNVVLTDHQAAVIETLVRSGRYQNASEVVREGLRLVEQRAAEDSARLDALRKAADIGWADIAAGRHTDVADQGLADFIGGLGRQAAERARRASNG
jgi:antitoxin ParD1/3/4